MTAFAIVWSSRSATAAAGRLASAHGRAGRARPPPSKLPCNSLADALCLTKAACCSAWTVRPKGIRLACEAVIVEGYMDVLAADQIRRRQRGRLGWAQR